MFEINININAPELVEAINNLAKATLARSLSVTEAAATVDRTPTSQTEKPKRERSKKQDDVEAQPPEKAQPEQPNEPESHESSASDTSQSSSDDVPTVVELRAKAQEVGTTPEAKKAIKALLEKFGAKSISDVPEDERAYFMAELALV